MSSLRKNTASQHISFCLINATTGAALTSASVTVKVSKDGTQGSGGGSVTELGSGQYDYAPSQADTNATNCGFLFTATSAIPVNMNFYTDNWDTTQAVLTSGSGTAQIAVSSGAVSTVTAVTNGVTVTTNNDKTGYALSASQTFNMTGNITGNLSGSVGTVTGGVTVTTNNDKTGYSLTQTFPTNFASLAVDVTGQVTVGTNNDKTGYSLTQSFPANFASLAITAGGVASADVKYVNGTQVTGNGHSGTEWGPV